MTGPCASKSRRGPKVPSSVFGPNDPALMGPATNSQNGSKSVNAARSPRMSHCSCSSPRIGVSWVSRRWVFSPLWVRMSRANTSSVAPRGILR